MASVLSWSIRKHFFLAESHANVLVGFAIAVKEAGGTCVATSVTQSDAAAQASGQLVSADWPDSARDVTYRWESMRASKLVLDA